MQLLCWNKLPWEYIPPTLDCPTMAPPMTALPVMLPQQFDGSTTLLWITHTMCRLPHGIERGRIQDCVRQQAVSYTELHGSSAGQDQQEIRARTTGGEWLLNDARYQPRWIDSMTVIWRIYAELQHFTPMIPPLGRLTNSLN